MKKMLNLFLLAGLLLVSTSSFAYNDPTFQAQIKMQTVGQKQGEPVREVKFVRFASRDANATSILSGDVVVYDTVSDDGVTVTRSIVSGDCSIAGIAATTILSADGSAVSAFDDAGRRNWGWVVVHGPMTANITAGGTNAHAARDPFYTSRDEGRISGPQTGDGAPQAAVLRMATSTGGFFMDAAVASETTADVFVKLE